MEEKIYLILEKCQSERLFGFLANRQAAKEITTHVMEFINWLGENSEPRVGNCWAVLNSDYATYTTMSLNEAYNHWLKNVKDV
jgi:hypothetical protein